MMEIVIKIPKEMYKSALNGYLCGSETLVNAIKNGIPLPEHHGRLIDADAFQMYCYQKNFDRALSDGGLATINLFLEFQPTIIEGSDSE